MIFFSVLVRFSRAVAPRATAVHKVPTSLYTIKYFPFCDKILSQIRHKRERVAGRTHVFNLLIGDSFWSTLFPTLITLTAHRVRVRAVSRQPSFSNLNTLKYLLVVSIIWSRSPSSSGFEVLQLSTPTGEAFARNRVWAFCSVTRSLCIDLKRG